MDELEAVRTFTEALLWEREEACCGCEAFPERRDYEYK